MRYPRWLLGRKVQVSGRDTTGTVVKAKLIDGTWHVQLYKREGVWYRALDVSLVGTEAEGGTLVP